MAQLVVLSTVSESELTLGPAAMAALARLGITNLSMARDRDTLAVVLDGWAFDPTRVDAVLAALGARADRTRTLQPVVQMAVNPATTQGGIPS